MGSPIFPRPPSNSASRSNSTPSKSSGDTTPQSPASSIANSPETKSNSPAHIPGRIAIEENFLSSKVLRDAKNELPFNRQTTQATNPESFTNTETIHNSTVAPAPRSEAKKLASKQTTTSKCSPLRKDIFILAGGLFVGTAGGVLTGLAIALTTTLLPLAAILLLGGALGALAGIGIGALFANKVSRALNETSPMFPGVQDTLPQEMIAGIQPLNILDIQTTTTPRPAADKIPPQSPKI